MLVYQRVSQNDDSMGQTWAKTGCFTLTFRTSIFWKTHEKTLLSLVNQHSYGKPPKCAIFIHFQKNPGTFTGKFAQPLRRHKRMAAIRRKESCWMMKAIRAGRN